MRNNRRRTNELEAVAAVRRRWSATHELTTLSYRARPSIDLTWRDVVKEGRHIEVLLKFAQGCQKADDAETDAKNRAEIVSRWNRWVEGERNNDKEFRPDLSLLDGEVFKGTPLWGTHWKNPKLDCLLLEGIDWRRARVMGAQLRGVCLDDARLEGTWLWEACLQSASLGYAHMEGADLRRAHLEGSWLSNTHLEGAQLYNAHLELAYGWYAHLDRAILCFAHLEGAHLGAVSLREANLNGAHIEGTILNLADFKDASVEGISYVRYRGVWPFRRDLMLSRYLGIRGVESCFGSPRFRRDAMDQDFIDQQFRECELQKWVHPIESRWFGWFLNSELVKTVRRVRWTELHRRLPKRFLFWLWSLSDYGRSTVGVMVYVFAAICALGGLYEWALIPGHHVELAGQLAADPNLPLAPWYAAAMGAATLGLTDLMKPLDFIGEFAIFGNALAGLVLFGMLIAVLQNKVARRS